jgi:hypothetical protein
VNALVPFLFGLFDLGEYDVKVAEVHRDLEGVANGDLVGHVRVGAAECEALGFVGIARG